jgi:predicted amidohydrolase YtcJ
VILEGGTIRTMDRALPVARALAVAGERIAGGVGTHETALPTPERVDLGGRCVVPGFSDAHVHFPTWALAQRQPRLEGCASLAEAVARVRAASEARSSQDWLVGYGWRSGDWVEGREPTRQDLDPLVGETPVALWSKDDHSLWLSSEGLRRVGSDLAVRGGVVEVDAAGEPTGVLREASAWRVRGRIAVSDDEYVEAMRAGVRLAHARGVTAVHDKDGWLGAPRLWQRLREESGLTLRVWQSLPHERLDELEALGLRSGIGDDWLRLGYLKAFMDGALGSGTAWLLDGSGVRITSGEELAAIVRRASRAGWPVAVHAIGDGANREALDAFESTREEWRPGGLRHRIEHVQCLDLEDLPRFAQLGVSCSVQFSHAPSDRDLAERSWADRLQGAYAYRALADSGALLANGSDAPIEELDPLEGIRAGVLRTLDEREPWRPEQALTVEQALAATTVVPAYLAGDERRRGTLVPGRLADLVVLDRDPVTCRPDELRSVEIVATMVAGRWVHNPPPWGRPAHLDG